MTSSAPRVLVPARSPGPHSWEVVGYRQARWVLSARCFSKDPRLAAQALGYHRTPEDPAAEQGRLLTLANSDPPAHTRLRRILARALTTARISRLRPHIAAAATRLADGMRTAGGVDLVRSFVLPLHVTVMGELLGVPPRDLDEFRALATGMRTPAAGESIPQSCQEAYRRMGELVARLLATRHEQIRPGSPPDRQPDLLGAMAAAQDAPDGPTAEEAQSLTMLLLSAGQEPTVDLVGNSLVALLLEPRQLRLFREHPALRPQAVEELLRCTPPVLSAPRIAAADVDVDGTPVRRGSVLAVMLADAHRDAAWLRDPEVLDITRTPRAHLSFGHGIHHCPGAPLARLEANLALTTLLTRFPRLALGSAPQELRWSRMPGRRGLAELPVEPGEEGVER